MVKENTINTPNKKYIIVGVLFLFALFFLYYINRTPKLNNANNFNINKEEEEEAAYTHEKETPIIEKETPIIEKETPVNEKENSNLELFIPNENKISSLLPTNFYQLDHNQDISTIHDIKSKLVNFWKEKKMSKKNFGCNDLDSLLPVLQLIYPYENSDKIGHVIDIGANVGDTTMGFVEAFSRLNHKRQVLDYDFNIVKCKLPKKFPKIVSVDAHPKTFNTFKERAEKHGWVEYGGVLPVQRAIDDVDNKVVTIGGEENSGRSKLGEGSHSVKTITVRSLIEEFLLSHIPDKYVRDNSWQIFLLKTDIEGYDYKAMVSSISLLKEKKVRIVSFEYHFLWTVPSPNSSLKKLTELFYEEANYVCYFVTSKGLFPISNSWWDSIYEIKYWSSVICSHENDSQFHKAIISYNLLI
jgi:hypothetical protein